MIIWMNNWPTESRLYWSIFTLCLNHPCLLGFLLDSEKASLREDPDELLRQAAAFSSSEYILVRIAIDLWCGLGEANILEVLETLDPENCRNFLRSLYFYAESYHKTQFA